MLRATYMWKVVALGSLFLGLAAQAEPKTVYEYYEVYEKYVTADGPRPDLKAKLDEFKWPREYNFLSEMSAGNKFGGILEQRDALGLSNQKIAIAVDALGRIVKEKNINTAGLKKADAAEANRIYSRVRTRALAQMNALYAALPPGRYRNQLEESLKAALTKMGEPLPAQVAVEKIAQKHPYERMVEVAEELAAEEGNTRNAQKLNSELEALSRKKGPRDAEISREERFNLAKRLLKAWKSKRPKLIQLTSDLPNRLIGPKEVQRFRGDEPATRDGFVDIWKDHFSNPNEIPGAFRSALVDNALEQLEKFDRSPPAIERQAHFLNHALNVSAGARQKWIERAEAISVEDSGGLKNARRYEIANELADNLKKADPDSATKLLAVPLFERLLDRSEIQLEQEGQREVRLKVADLLNSYSEKGSDALRQSAATARTALLAEAKPIEHAEGATPEAPKHPWERAVEIADKMVHGTLSTNDAAALMQELEEILKKPIAADALELSRKKRFELAKKLLEVWKGAKHRPKLLQVTGELPDLLIGSKSVQRYHGEDGKTRDGFVEFWMEHFQKPKEIQGAFRPALVDNALKQLEAFGFPPPAIERHAHILNHALGSTQATRTRWLETARAIPLEDVKELTNARRYEIANELLESLKTADPDPSTKLMAIPVFERLLDRNDIHLEQEGQKTIRANVAALLDSYQQGRGSDEFRAEVARARGEILPRGEMHEALAAAPKHPLERIVEIAEEFKNNPGMVSNEAAERQRTIYDLMGQSIGTQDQLSRDQRFDLAKRLLESWKGANRPSLVATTAPLVGNLIGGTGGVHRYGTQKEEPLRKEYITYFNNLFDRPGELSVVHRNELISEAINQLEALRAPRHPLERFVFFMQRASELTAPARPPWLAKAEALVPKLGQEGLRPAERFALAKRLGDVLESDPRVGKRRPLGQTAESQPAVDDANAKFHSRHLGMAAGALAELLDKKHVKVAGPTLAEGVSHSDIRDNAERILAVLSETKSLGAEFQHKMADHRKEIGGKPPHPMEQFVYYMQEAGKLSAIQSRTPWLNKAAELIPRLGEEGLLPADRFALAKRLNDVIEQDPRIGKRRRMGERKSEDPVAAEPVADESKNKYSYRELDLAAEGLAELLDKKHVKVASSVKVEGSTQSSIRTNSERILGILSEMPRNGPEYQQQMATRLKNIGGIPMYNANQYLDALEELERLWKTPTEEIGRRQKLDVFLRQQDPAAYLDSLGGIERQLALERVAKLLDNERLELRDLALDSIAAMAKNRGARPLDLPAGTLERIRAMSVQDVRTHDGLTRNRENAVRTLAATGHSAVIQLNSALDYMKAVREIGEHKGPPSRRIKELEAAVEGFDKTRLSAQMNLVDRKLAVAEILSVLKGTSTWASLRALEATPGLLGASTLDAGSSNAILDKVWELTHRQEHELPKDRTVRLGAIAALEKLGEKPAENIDEWIQALKQVDLDTRDIGAVRNARARVLDLFNVQMASRKLGMAERRRALDELSKVIASAETRDALRERALVAFGDLAAIDARNGSGIPRTGFDTLRSLSQAGTKVPYVVRRALEETIERIGITGSGPVTPLANLDLYDAKERVAVPTLVERIRNGNDAEKVRAIQLLDAWGAEEIPKEAGSGGAAKGLALTMGDLALSSNPEVRRAAIEQIWRWSRQMNPAPAWLVENQKVLEGLYANLDSNSPEIRAAVMDALGNHFEIPQKPNPQLINALRRVIQSPSAPEDARWVAAHALSRQLITEPNALRENQFSLRTAFARSPDHRKAAYAELMNQLVERGAPRPGDASLMASGWVHAARTSDGAFDGGAVARSLQAEIDPGDVDRMEKGLSALLWLSADSLDGKSSLSATDANRDLPTPEWLAKDPETLAKLLRLLVHPEQKIRDRAAEFFKNRKPWVDHPVSDELASVAWEVLAKTDRYSGVSQLVSKFIHPDNRPDRSGKIWTAAEANRALDAAIAVYPQFQADAVADLRDAFASLEKIKTEASENARPMLAGKLADLIDKIEEQGNEASRPAVMCLAAHIWRGSGKSEIPQEITERVGKVFRGILLANKDGEETELDRYAKEALRAMNLKAYLIAPEDRKKRPPAPQPPLSDIAGRLLSDYPETQQEAVKDLVKFWKSPRPGEKSFQEVLGVWHRKGGPDWDDIVASVLRGQFADAAPGEAPLASIEMRRALADAVVELIKDNSKAGYQPGLRPARQTNIVMAELLYSDDPKLREAAEAWIKRIRTSEGEDHAWSEPDKSIETALVEGLKNPARRQRTLQILDNLVPFKVGVNMTPAWLRNSIEIQGALLDLIASEPKDGKASVAELLLTKVHNPKARKADDPVRSMKKTDKGYEVDRTPQQERFAELIPKALRILEEGDAFAKQGAMEFLTTLEVPDVRIPKALHHLAADMSQPKSVREQAAEMLSYRSPSWDFSSRDKDISDIVTWAWDRFLNENDPELRREAARVLFAYTDFIRSMPGSKDVSPPGQDSPIAHRIVAGFLNPAEATKHNPLPDDLKALADLGYSEVRWGTGDPKGRAIEILTAADEARGFGTPAEGTAPSRSSLRSFAEKCRGR